MKVQTKLTSLLLLLVIIISAGRLLYQNFENSQVDLIFKELAQHESRDLDELIRLKGENLGSFVKDYTYWDEMVNFVQNADMEWAAQMLDTSLDTYKASGLWVYKTDSSLLYSVNDSGERSDKGLPLAKGALTKIFASSPLCHFFLDTPSGLMEVRGATIHPTEDAQRKTPAQGYFFAGRLWNREYIEELADLMEGTVTITGLEKEAPLLKIIPEKSTVILLKGLPGWDGRPAAYINAEIISKEMVSYNRFSKNTMIIFVIFAVSVVVFIMLYLTFSVSLPFKSISQALKKEKPEYLIRLEKGEDEFGDISRLIHRFFEQKDELTKENSERKKAENEINKLEEIKGRLTHMIIHDLNNPLTAMFGELQLLKMTSEGKFSEVQNKSLEAALRANRDLKRMISDLLDVDKMEEGKIKLRPENFFLGEVAGQIIEQMKIIAAGDNIALSFDRPENIPAVSADKEIVNRIITNLINNSLKFTPEKGSIILKVFHKPEEGRLYVQVKDTGSGIPGEYLDRIFDKFFQIETQVKTGYGLGLTFCKMMVEAHGGSIWAESEGPGRGTTITFTLPA